MRRPPLRLALHALAASLILAAVACGGSEDGGPAAPPSVTSVSVAVEPAEITVGQEAAVTVTVQRSDGSSGPATSVAYAVSDPAVASVSGGGVVTGISEGAVQVVASVDGVEGSAEVQVVARFAEELTLVDSTEVTLVSTDEQRAAGELRFLGASAEDYEEGAIVLGEQAGGFLRRITAVEVRGDTVVLSTEFASLEEVLRGATFETRVSLDVSQPGPARVGGVEWGPTELVYTAPGVNAEEGGFSFDGAVLYKDQVCGQDPKTGATVCGTFTVDLPTGQLDFTPEADIGATYRWNRGLTDFHFVLTGDLSTDVSLRAAAAVAGEVSGSATLGTFRKPFVVTICCVPTPLGALPVGIPGEIRVELVGAFKAGLKLEGSVTAGATGAASVSAGARYDGEWEPVFESTGEFETRPLDWDQEVEATLRFEAKPVATAIFLSYAGPAASIYPYVTFGGKVGLDDCSYEGTVTAGIDMEAAFKVEILGESVKEYPTSAQGPSTVLLKKAGRLVDELFAVGGEGQEGKPGETLTVPLEVLVVDTDVMPSPEIQVAFTAEEGSGSVSPATATTDATGQVKAFWTLGPDEGTHRVTARTPDCEGANEVVFTAEAVIPEEERPAGAVAGSVVLVEPGSSTPLAGATVVAEAVAGAPGRVASAGLPYGAEPASASAPAGPAGVTTDADGDFRIDGLEPGDYTLLVSSDVSVTTRVYQVRVTDGGVDLQGTIEVVRPSESPGTLDVTVLRMPADPFPVPDALVELRSGVFTPDDEPVAASGSTGPLGSPTQGKVTIADVPAGTYRVKVVAPGGGVNREGTVVIGGEERSFVIYVHP